MPKRMISDAIWKSKKIRKVQPAEFRVEYTWIIAAVEDNGVFEYDPETLWAQAYALARPGWTPDRVKELLDEFIRVGLLLKYEAAGKTWCYLVGSDKEGRLPPPSQRYSKLPPPSAKDQPTVTLGLPYGEPRPDLGTTYGANGDAVIGIGSGLGLGNGHGVGDDSIALTLTAPIALAATVPVVQQKTRRDETEQEPIHNHNSDISITLADYLHSCMKEHNPDAFNSAPPKWKQYWAKDMETLLPVYPEQRLHDIIKESQINPIFRKYVVRGAGLVDMADSIYDHLMNHGMSQAKADEVEVEDDDQNVPPDEPSLDAPDDEDPIEIRHPELSAMKYTIRDPVEGELDPARRRRYIPDGGQGRYQPRRQFIPEPSASAEDEGDSDNEVKNQMAKKAVAFIDSKDVWERLSVLKDVWKEVSDRNVNLINFRHILRDHKLAVPEDNPVEYLADVIRWTMRFWAKREELAHGSASFAARFEEIQQDYASEISKAEAGENKIMALDFDEEL
jgi:hypothetical protein